ncbi:MAG: hypothetical protein KatS3mg102_1447 [Planctomycetota bacterium]|nr:MAG: hypothetical protein KatS3mg102_1447 [Planctomycetota bacterium]
MLHRLVPAPRRGAVARACALLATASALGLLVPPAAGAKDCGERPTGTNPGDAELLAAVEEFSLAYQVPIEIILAVAHRESGVQQWRPDGSLVVNEQDCGLGMMQLTGSTAEQFDVPRLKSDWRYNLQAGVEVLDSKWRRAERERWKSRSAALPPPDRTILENWYYALSYYQGRRTGEYPGKVFEHLRERPGRLRRLLPAPLEVSNPELAIEGFSYGMGFTALAGDQVVLEDGRRLRVRTTRGTLGDPRLLAQLEQLLARAERALARNQPAEALRWLRVVREHAASSALGRRAAELWAAIEQQAQAALAEADRRRAAGEYTRALAAYAEIEKRYPGLAAAEQAAERAEAIRTDPELRERAARAEREAEAAALGAKAERALARNQTAEALRLLRLLAERYPDTPAGGLAARRLDELERDPEFMARAHAAELAQQARRLVALGDTYRSNGLYERAIACYEQALALEPEPELARRAREGLRQARERLQR